MQVDPHVGEPADLTDRERDRLRSRRDNGAWYAVAGIAMLFAGGFHVGFAIGGVLMVLYGIAHYLYWGRRLSKADDAWDDPEIDAWEREHFGR